MSVLTKATETDKLPKQALGYEERSDISSLNLSVPELNSFTGPGTTGGAAEPAD